MYLDSILREYRMAPVPEDSALRRKLDAQDKGFLKKYFLSLCPNAHNSTDLMERNRLIRAIEIAEFSRAHSQIAGPPVTVTPLVFGIHLDRKELRRRITIRLQARLQAGMIDEVQRLHDRGIAWERIESFGLEYRYIGRYLQRKIDREEMIQTLNTRIQQFAKRQETWFRGMEKKGVFIHWIDGIDEGAALRLIAGSA